MIWPRRIRLFQLVVRDRPVLIYAGRSEHDLARYVTMEAGRTVYKFQGDVLATADSDMFATGATPEQVSAWAGAFRAAVKAGEAKFTNPTAFALAVD
jgi:hypothetical protein